MAEQRVNGFGQVVEFNETSGRWEPVKGEETFEQAAPVVPDAQETHEPVPEEDETLVFNENTTPRRAQDNS